MIIIGCDFHTRYQQIAMAREETDEVLVAIIARACGGFLFVDMAITERISLRDFSGKYRDAGAPGSLLEPGALG